MVKKLRSSDLEEENKQSLENETKLLSKLRHFNIVSFFDSFIDRDRALNIVMEYCDGGELHQKIHQKSIKPFSEDVV